MKKIIKSLTALILALLLTGCFEMSEEIWINRDASSQVSIDLSLSEKIVGFSEAVNAANKQETSSHRELLDLENIKSNLLKNSSINKVDIQEYSDAGIRHFIVNLELRDFRQISKLSEKTLANSDNIHNFDSFFAIKDVSDETISFQLHELGTPKNLEADLKGIKLS